MSNYYNKDYYGSSISEDDVNRSFKAPDSVMDIDDYNAEMARLTKKTVDKKLKTFIPYIKTPQIYAAKKLPYKETEDVRRIHNFVIESNENYSRKVTRIYKVLSPSNNGGLYLMWNEIRYGKTGLGNPRSVTVDCLGRYYDPEPNRQLNIDGQSQRQQIINTGVAKINTRYELPFSKDLVDELLKDAESPFTIEFYLELESKPDHHAKVNYEEFINPDFERIYHEKMSLRTGQFNSHQVGVGVGILSSQTQGGQSVNSNNDSKKH